MENCLYCNKKLRPFTKATMTDWINRPFHRACYKKKQLDICYSLMMDDFIESSS